MAKKTIQQNLIEALLARGCTKVKVLSGCVVMTHPSDGFFLYVGKLGSLRRGRNRTMSLPVDGLKARLLEGRP